MNRRLACRALGPALLCWAAHAPAQSLAELVQRSNDRDPVVQAAAAQTEAARQRLYQARAAFGPTLSATASQSTTSYADLNRQETTPFRGKQGSVQLNQPLLRAALFPAHTSAAALLDQAQAQFEQARLESAQRLLEAVFETLKARDTLLFLDAQRTLTEEQLAAAQRKYRVGRAPITDQREAEAKADVVAAQHQGAQNDLALRQQQLIELLGELPDAFMAKGLADQRLPPLPSRPVGHWVEEGLAASPQVRQARFALVSAAAEVDKAALAHSPTLDLTASYTRNRDSGSVTFPQPRNYNATQVGVNFTVPLFASGATQFKVQETMALRDKAQAELDSASRSLSIAVRQQHTAAMSAATQARAFATAVRSGEAALQANQRGYEVGLRVAAEVLDAQTKLFDSQRELTKARYDAWLSWLKLNLAAGRLEDADLALVDDALQAGSPMQAPAPSLRQPRAPGAAPR